VVIRDTNAEVDPAEMLAQDTKELSRLLLIVLPDHVYFYGRSVAVNHLARSCNKTLFGGIKAI
jgi:hypothetical protein